MSVLHQCWGSWSWHSSSQQSAPHTTPWSWSLILFSLLNLVHHSIPPAWLPNSGSLLLGILFILIQHCLGLTKNHDDFKKQPFLTFSLLPTFLFGTIGLLFKSSALFVARPGPAFEDLFLGVLSPALSWLVFLCLGEMLLTLLMLLSHLSWRPRPVSTTPGFSTQTDGIFSLAS